MDASKFLFYDFASSDFDYHRSERERYLSRFRKKKITPDAYGFMMEVPGLFKSGKDCGNGYEPASCLYDFEGNMIQKIQILSQ